MSPGDPTTEAGDPPPVADGPAVVLFDLDDTLCRPATPRDEQLRRLFDRAGVEPFFDTRDLYRRMRAVDADSESELFGRVFTGLAEGAGRADAAPALLEAAVELDRERDDADVVALPGARETLDALAGDYRLGLVTNGPADRQRAKLDALGLTDAFDAAVYAEPGRPIKPDPAPFERALDALDERPERALHVGNALGADVAGAHNAGLRSVWLPDDHSPRDGPDPHHRVDALSEVPPLVRSLHRD